jgi:hypothetical protein
MYNIVTQVINKDVHAKVAQVKRGCSPLCVFSQSAVIEFQWLGLITSKPALFIAPRVTGRFCEKNRPILSKQSPKMEPK